jgi:hypothetical protein
MVSNLLPQHGRYEYLPITERKDYNWPGGKRLAFCITTNIECFAFIKGRGHDSAKHGEPQTQRNYAWRDYGNRVGIWRLFDLFDELKLPAAHNTNSLRDCLRESNQRLTLLTVCSTPSNSAKRLSPCRFAVIGHP